MKRRKAFPTFYLTLVLLFTYIPVIMVVVFSFSGSKIPGSWGGFTTDWYRKVFSNSNLMNALGNSLVVAGWSVGLSAVIGTLGAVGMTRSHFRGQGSLELLATLPMMIPEIILGMAYMALFSAIGFRFGMPTLVVTHTTFCVPYVLINVKGRLASMDPALEEAARDLGAGPWRTFFDVTLPTILPAVLSGMLLALAMSMDDVVISSFVKGPTSETLPTMVNSGLKTGVTPEINALSTLILGVVFIAVAISQLAGLRRQAKRDRLMAEGPPK